MGTFCIPSDCGLRIFLISAASRPVLCYPVLRCFTCPSRLALPCLARLSPPRASHPTSRHHRQRQRPQPRLDDCARARALARSAALHSSASMRPLRLLLSLTTTLLAVTLLLFVALGGHQDEQLERTAHAQPRPQSSLTSRLSFTSPASLFPPSAIISLTDDNSTFFLARPAAFGPPLPNAGLSGPLWIGSGFGDDAFGHGELGCSDIPGWGGDGDSLIPAAHAPSRQDSANITGKVALLKRGGCGFLAKVEWAQQRGAVAVIVGDNVRGGGLIRMYAQGDTSNVTIPSLFTSHTTAHLLSSLLPSGNVLQGLWPDKQQKQYLDHNPTSAHPTERATPSSIPGDQDPDSGWVRSLLSAVGLVGDPDNASSATGTNNIVTSQSQPATSSAANTKYTAPNARKRSWTRFSSAKPMSIQQRSVASIAGLNINQVETSSGRRDIHEGLWVTLTPTDVSSSPFFDTLLVLVVSPLVTLTVVYALLLLRSRIRRRRWRAPKSVVERLPVRTYQTISDPSSSPSTTSEVASPTTPLLQHSPTQTTTPAPRPHSAADPEPSSSSTNDRTRTREEEKHGSGLAAWRRRYGGRQKECVVCLEEYVDGVSQVMSLPCGHEFHAECMWVSILRLPFSN